MSRGLHTYVGIVTLCLRVARKSWTESLNWEFLKNNNDGATTLHTSPPATFTTYFFSITTIPTTTRRCNSCTTILVPYSIKLWRWLELEEDPRVVRTVQGGTQAGFVSKEKTRTPRSDQEKEEGTAKCGGRESQQREKQGCTDEFLWPENEAIIWRTYCCYH